MSPEMPENRPTPAEFDGLFRSEGATTQQPAYGGGHRTPPPGGYEPQGGYASQGAYEPQGRAAGRGDGQRRISPKVLIGGVVALCAVAGLGAGALLSGGDGGGSAQAAQQTTAPSTGGDQQQGGQPKGKPSDPVAAQAQALDALLKDSSANRDAVISAVEAIKTCKDPGTAATTLRTAATQRTGLVTRLDKTAIDKLPGQAELKAELTQAWNSSASADNHFAAWADQVGGKHGCIKGHGRPTGQTAQANKASGDATAAKKKAADLWNPIAQKYGLTQRQFTQL
jgi:hypothetical protein